MDWKRCIICQKSTSEDLQCTANSKIKDSGVGYVRFAREVKVFKNLGVDVICFKTFAESIEFQQNIIDNKDSCLTRHLGTSHVEIVSTTQN